MQYSPHVRESTKVLDSGSQPLDSNPLDSGFQHSGFRIPYQSGDPGFQNHCGFRIPDSLTWGDNTFRALYVIGP